MSQKQLSDLTAKELKIIAKNNGIEFESHASAASMLELLEKNGIRDVSEEKPSDQDDVAPETTDSEEEMSDEPKGTEEGLVEEIKAPAEVSATRVDNRYEVVTNLKSGGKRYAPGQTVSLSPREAAQLLADGVVK